MRLSLFYQPATSSHLEDDTESAGQTLVLTTEEELWAAVKERAIQMFKKTLAYPRGDIRAFETNVVGGNGLYRSN
jgi:hypothetical protein